MSKNKENKTHEPSIQDLEQVTYDAMRHCGLVPPLSIDEITAIESELENIELPFGPSDPRALLERLSTGSDREESTILLIPIVDTEDVNNLARAARQGGELSKEVEQRMAEDKAKYLQNEK
jgi:hypothetical protein